MGPLAGSKSDQRPAWTSAFLGGRSPPAAACRQGFVDERMPGTADGIGQVELPPDVDEQRAVDVVVSRAGFSGDSELTRRR